MAFYKCDKAPASAPGDLFWETPDSVVEVIDPVLAHELGRLTHAGFHEVGPPEVKVPAKPKAAVAEAK